MAKRGKKGRAAGKAFAVAFLVTLAVLLVGGFGTGTLDLGTGAGAASWTTLGCSSQVAPCYTNDTQSGTVGQSQLGFGVAVSQAVTAGGGGYPLVTSFNGNGATSSISFGFSVANLGGNCHNDVVWDGGAYNDEMWYSIAYYPAGASSPAQATFTINGAQYTGTYVAPSAISGNGTQSGQGLYLYGCVTPNNPIDQNYGWTRGATVGHFNQTEIGLSTTSIPTVSISNLGSGSGTAVVGYLQIGFHAAGWDCDNGMLSAASGNVDCAAMAQNLGYNPDAEPGGTNVWRTASYALIPIVPGGGAVQVSGAGPFFNGQTVSTVVTTGYAGSTGWSLQVSYPSVRGDGGQDAPWTLVGSGLTSPIEGIANDLFAGQVYSFNIPAGASVLNQNPLWNIYTFTLYSAFWQQTTTPVQVDVSPAYVPGIANITLTDTTTGDSFTHGGQITLGDSLGIGLTSYSPGNPIATFVVEAFYTSSTQGQSANSPPACASGAWISPCSGLAVSAATVNPGNYSGAYPSFAVSPPSGYNGIGIAVVSETANGQGSSTSYANLGIASKCVSDCSSAFGLTFGALIPYLTATLITTGIGAIVLLMFGSGIAAWSTIAVVGVASFSAAAFGAFDGLVVAGSTVMRTAGEIKLRSILEALTAGG